MDYEEVRANRIREMKGEEEVAATCAELHLVSVDEKKAHFNMKQYMPGRTTGLMQMQVPGYSPDWTLFIPREQWEIIGCPVDVVVFVSKKKEV